VLALRVIARQLLADALAGTVAVEELSLVEPVLFLDAEPGPPERWNYEAAFARLFDDSPAEAGVRFDASVVLRGASIESGQLSVRPPGPDGPYLASDIDARIPLAILAPADPDAVPRIVVAQLDATLAAPTLEGPLALTATSARLRLPDDAVAFELERLAADGAEITAATGSWRFDTPGLGLTLDARFANLPLELVEPYFPQLPATGVASFTLGLQPAADARTAVLIADLAAAADGSEVTGTLGLLVGGDAPITIEQTSLLLDPLAIALLEPVTGPLPYSGTLRGSIEGPGDALTFDLDARLVSPDLDEPVDTRLVGRASLTDGFEIERLAADLEDVPAAALEPFAPGVLPPGALITGRVEIDGVPGRAPLALDIDVRLNGGRVVAQGTLDLAGPVAAYDLAGRVVDLPVGALVPVEVPPVTLTAAFSLAGQGTEPETIDARVALDGGFGAWRTEPGDGIRLDADVEDGRLALDTLSLELATLRLDAAGAWRYATPTAGGIDYDLDVTSLEPFGPYLPPPVRGAVWGSATTRGELTGTLDVPRFAGEADAEDLRYADWFIGAAAADYAVTAPPRRGLELDLAAETVETPQLGAFDRVLLRARARDPSFDVTLNATRPGRDDGVLLVADGRFLDGTSIATLRDLRFDLDGSPWTLVEPATVRWGDEVDGLDVSDLRLREADGDGVLAFDGRYPPDGADGLRFQAEAVPIAEWFRLADRAPPLTGMVWADGELFGTLASPRVDLDFRLLRPRIDDVQFARLEGVLAYGAGRLAGDVDVRVDTVPATGGTLDIDGGVPFNLSLTDGFDARLAETGAIEITAVADRFPFVVLEPLLFDLRDPEGWIDGRVVAGGTIRRPRLDGRLILRCGDAGICAVRADGTGLRQLASSPVSAWARSPDDTRIAYSAVLVTPSLGYGLYVMEAGA
ncbi:MAG: hypothetical protein ACOC8B_07500, partial [Gemmatimonadota bacterium]